MSLKEARISIFILIMVGTFHPTSQPNCKSRAKELSKTKLKIKINIQADIERRTEVLDLEFTVGYIRPDEEAGIQGGLIRHHVTPVSCGMSRDLLDSNIRLIKLDLSLILRHITRQ